MLTRGWRRWLHAVLRWFGAREGDERGERVPGGMGSAQHPVSRGYGCGPLARMEYPGESVSALKNGCIVFVFL